MARSIIAVIVSYLIFAITGVALFAMRGKDPHLPPGLAFALSSITCGTAAACAAGYSAALIARRRPILHAAIVAGIVAAGAASSIIAQPSTSHWSQIAALCVMAPAAIVGGWLRARGMGKAPPGFSSNSDKRQGQ